MGAGFNACDAMSFGEMAALAVIFGDNAFAPFGRGMTVSESDVCGLGNAKLGGLGTRRFGAASFAGGFG